MKEEEYEPILPVSMEALWVRRSVGRALPVPLAPRNDFSQPWGARSTDLGLPSQKPKLERAPLVVPNHSPRRFRRFKRSAQRTEATNLLVFRMDDEVGRILRGHNGDAGHTLGFLGLLARKMCRRRGPTSGTVWHPSGVFSLP